MQMQSVRVDSVCIKAGRLLEALELNLPEEQELSLVSVQQPDTALLAVCRHRNKRKLADLPEFGS